MLWELSIIVTRACHAAMRWASIVSAVCDNNYHHALSKASSLNHHELNLTFLLWGWIDCLVCENIKISLYIWRDCSPNLFALWECISKLPLKNQNCCFPTRPLVLILQRSNSNLFSRLAAKTSGIEKNGGLILAGMFIKLLSICLKRSGNSQKLLNYATTNN